MFSTPLTTINDHSPWQLEFTQSGIFMLFTIIPAVLNLASIIPMFFYKLSGNRMLDIQKRLQTKRESDSENLLEKLEENSPEVFGSSQEICVDSESSDL